MRPILTGCRRCRRSSSPEAPENVRKFELIRPQPDTYRFAGDSLVAFAEEHGMRVRGHTLVWYQQLPGWVKTKEWTRDKLVEVLHDHLRTSKRPGDDAITINWEER